MELHEESWKYGKDVDVRAAAQQGKFQGFHDALYAGGPVSDASIRAAAAKAGVSLAAIDTTTVDAEIARNMQTAAKLGMNGTPSWVVGDRVVYGFRGLVQGAL